MDDFEVHKHMQNIEKAIARTDRDKQVCKENKVLITRFARDRLAKGVGRLRVAKCVYCLRYLAHWLVKPYEQASKQDLIDVIGMLENSHYAEHTKHDYKVISNSFSSGSKAMMRLFRPKSVGLRPA